MNEIINILNNGNYSCVIKNQDEIRTFIKRGVADLFDLHQNDKDFLNGAIIADKVIGKAAAALIISGNVKSVYTKIISSNALELFKNKDYTIHPSDCSNRSDGYKNGNKKVEYETEVPVVINRNKTDWCPLEKLCYNENSIENIIEIIRTFLVNLKSVN